MTTVFNNRLTKCLKIRQLALVLRLSPLPASGKTSRLSCLLCLSLPFAPEFIMRLSRSGDGAPQPGPHLEWGWTAVSSPRLPSPGAPGLYPPLQPHLFTHCPPPPASVSPLPPAAGHPTLAALSAWTASPGLPCWLCSLSSFPFKHQN